MNLSLRVINTTIHPNDGYIGLGDKELDEIREIVNSHPKYVDNKLESLLYSLEEDQYIAHMSRVKFPEYDLNRKLIDHVLKEYKRLRLKLQLTRREPIKTMREWLSLSFYEFQRKRRRKKLIAGMKKIDSEE